MNTSLETTYYKNAVGKSGPELKKTLHKIISKQTKLGYDDVWEALYDTDQDPNNKNNVILFYTGRSQSKLDHGTGNNQWNREHVWAKSHGDFGTRVGPGTDLHHLKPTDVSVNGDRSNLDFDNDDGHRNDPNGQPVGTTHNEAPDTFYDDNSWEPRDEIKGDVARIILYMDTRYEGGNGELDLEAVDGITNVRSKEPKHGMLSTLLEWNQLDPVDDFERRRNEVIYMKYQHNRNPFIDHPEWVDLIWN
ncbi:endonuclease [Paenibacillus polymyxa]|nr:endonuclease [Paenibacillus polymyxa]WCM63943.1 endonuclease [Paenibacillus polymyxa]